MKYIPLNSISSDEIVTLCLDELKFFQLQTNSGQLLKLLLIYLSELRLFSIYLNLELNLEQNDLTNDSNRLNRLFSIYLLYLVFILKSSDLTDKVD